MMGSSFVEILGAAPQVRILEVFLQGGEYSISDIARASKIGRATFYRLMDDLLENGVLVKTRKFGTIQLYKLNEESVGVQALVEFHAKVVQKRGGEK